MSTSTFASRILALVSVVRRRSFPTQAKRRLEWGTLSSRPIRLSSRPVSLSSRPRVAAATRVEGPAFSVPSCASALLLAVFMLAAASAHAQTTYTVTNTASSGTGSLAAAVASVDADRGTPGDTIVFASGVTGTITLGSTLTLSQNVTISGPGTTGPGANLLTISGNNAVTVFSINSGVTASISGLTITGGNGTNGGGIYNAGTLTVSNSTISNNNASQYGGGIYSTGALTVSNNSVIFNNISLAGSGIFSAGGPLTVSNSIIAGNYITSSTGGGGGIDNQYGTATVSNSTISDNSAGSGGVGDGIVNGGALTVSNSTISGNGVSSSLDGGGIFNGGTLTVNNSTISNNAASNGGGIFNNNSNTPMTITNSIVAGNTDSSTAGDDCDSCGTQSGNNLISTPSNIINPMLGPLQYNGGPTQTMLPQPNSPALNAGLSSTLSTDQRGFPRPTGTGVVSDLGAVQVGPLIVTTTADSTDTSAVCDGSDTCSLRDAITLANSQGSGDISFASSITSTPSTITLGSALPPITATNITITGPGANLLTVSGKNLYQVFNINSSSVTASLSGLTIANGSAPAGGGINNAGTLTVSNSTLSGNASTANCGTPPNPPCIGNSAGGGGGGIANNGTLTINNSTFSGNSAGGGGIANNGTLTINNSTFSGNTANDGGGIANNGGTVTVSNSTFSGNTAQSGGGIANNNGGTVTMTNSIVAGNTDAGAPGQDCYSCTLSGNNLVSTLEAVMNFIPAGNFHIAAGEHSRSMEGWRSNIRRSIRAM